MNHDPVLAQKLDIAVTSSTRDGQGCAARDGIAQQLEIADRRSIKRVNADPESVDSLRRAKLSPPRALIVTIYGLYSRECVGWLSIGSLIRFLAALDVAEPAVRSSISRLKKRGVLVAERKRGLAGYSLSTEAHSILRSGDARIFEPQRARLKDGWLLAVFSVPESERGRRHQIRSRLTALGFGTVSSGVWIAPAHVEQEARDSLVGANLSGYVDLFRAEHAGFIAERDAVNSWWDLTEIKRAYRDFVAAHSSTLATWGATRLAQDDEAAFSEYVRILTHWRRLPYLDPGLPTALLPQPWSGTRAVELFSSLRTSLEPDAHRHMTTVAARRHGDSA